MSKHDSVLLPEIMVFAGPNGSGKSTITRIAVVKNGQLSLDIQSIDDISLK